MRRIVAWLSACLLAGCSSLTGGGESTDTYGFTAGDGAVTIVAEAERSPAPTLSGPTLSGGHVSSGDFAGRIVVINVWGSWCAPCRHEAPELVAADERLGDDVQFLGLNTRDLSEAPAQAFVRSFSIGYPNIFDPDGKLLLGFDALPPKAIPSTLVIDREGRVAARVLGEVDANTLVSLVEDLR